MRVELLNKEMVNSDLGVVNAARCSFDKESKWYSVTHIDNGCEEQLGCEIKGHHENYQLNDGDKKLINYLAKHQHWTPFAHAQEVFELEVSKNELLHFFINANLSGFEWCVLPITSPLRIRGSLYAWSTNAEWFPTDIRSELRHRLRLKYPVSMMALDTGDNMAVPGSNRIFSIYNQALSRVDELNTHTLRIHAPIFVKRQLETHRRNFVMTDIEDFSQNEVSRRYVESEPEIYRPQKWRMQSKNKKQGSSDEVLSGIPELFTNSDYTQLEYTAPALYKAMNARGITHEQSRMVLPLSTYTTWWWTGSLKSWKRLFALRLQDDVQSETRELCEMIHTAITTA